MTGALESETELKSAHVNMVFCCFTGSGELFTENPNPVGGRFAVQPPVRVVQDYVQERCATGRRSRHERLRRRFFRRRSISWGLAVESAGAVYQKHAPSVCTAGAITWYK